jgi:hypothetical protein
MNLILLMDATIKTEKGAAIMQYAKFSKFDDKWTKCDLVGLGVLRNKRKFAV